MERVIFDIREFQKTLIPAKEKGKFICPSCEGHNLSINQKNGAYKCWNGCEEKAIREAIQPWNEVAQPSPGNPRKPTKPKPTPQTKKSKPVPVPVGDLILARLSDFSGTVSGDFPIARIPEWKPKNVPDDAREIIYEYSCHQTVHRFEWIDESNPKGRTKTFRQRHINAEGLPEWNKGSELWEAYRLFEAIASIQSLPAQNVPCLLVQEGEKSVEIARSIGLASITFQGSAWGKDDICRALKELRTAHRNICIIFLADNDEAGIKKSHLFEEICQNTEIPCFVFHCTLFCEKLIEKGDIEEILQQMTSDEFIRKLEEELHRKIDENSAEQEKTEETEEKAPDSFKPVAEFTQKALEILYGDEPWICVSDRLYKWHGTYYQESPDILEKQRLSNFCNGYAVTTAQGIRYPYAKPVKVKEALEWVKMRLAIDPKLINPPGINCTNGVLNIFFDFTGKPSHRLVPHDPNIHYYLSEPLIEYKPNANPEHCDRLLEALDAPYRDIFLKTIAASMDLASVRKFKGRAVKALLLKGDGNNGKDSLREVVSLIYGHTALTSIAIEAFKQADNGRLFPVARLEHSRVNWPSENKNAALDKLQSLKIAISGDRSFVVERKCENDYETAINAVFLFNWNDSPKLSAAQEAIKSRFAVIPFSKCFAARPDKSKAELQADARFKYDPQFVREEVAPAFLNRVLESLEALMTEGIDYDATEETLETIRSEANHLWAFALDTGLHVVNGGKLYTSDIWQKLKDWYLANGTLEIETTDRGKEKHTWYEQANPGDRLCKAINQIPARIGAIFPKAKKGRDEYGTFLSNLTFSYPSPPDSPPDSPDSPPDSPDSPPDSPDSPAADFIETDNPVANCYIPEATAEAVNHTERGAVAIDPIFMTAEEKISSSNSMNSEEPREISSFLVEENASSATESLPEPITASATSSESATESSETATASDRVRELKVKVPDWVIGQTLLEVIDGERKGLRGLFQGWMGKSQRCALVQDQTEQIEVAIAFEHLRVFVSFTMGQQVQKVKNDGWFGIVSRIEGETVWVRWEAFTKKNKSYWGIEQPHSFDEIRNNLYPLGAAIVAERFKNAGE